MKVTKDRSVVVLALGLLLASAACSSSSAGPADDEDAGTGGDGGVDAASGEDSGNDSASTHDAATGADSATGSDSSTPTEAGAGALGATCTSDGGCASGMCEPFHMMTEMLCTKPCTVATQSTDCPDPPTAGTCTPNGYCKFD